MASILLKLDTLPGMAIRLGFGWFWVKKFYVITKFICFSLCFILFILILFPIRIFLDSFFFYWFSNLVNLDSVPEGEDLEFCLANLSLLVVRVVFLLPLLNLLVYELFYIINFKFLPTGIFFPFDYGDLLFIYLSLKHY